MSQNVKSASKPLSTDEKRALLARLLKEKGNAATAEVPVHRMFEARVREQGSAIAVSDDARQWTYAELNARANHLAHRLRDLGVKPGTLVALCVERSAAMVAGLLGILKAGGAYVPIDPLYPSDRVAFMLGDSRAPVLVAELATLENLPIEGTQVVRLDSDFEGLDEQADANVDGGASGEDLAYVIYTSGSTGKPKGVMIPHRALTNFLLAMRPLLGMTAGDTLAAVTTLSFDIAALEMYLPLVVGGRIDVVPREEVADSSRLAARLDQNQITYLQATPATWRLLLEGGWSGRPALTMLCGGEALPRDLADRLLPMGKTLWNLYGPTETTIWSSAAKVEIGDAPISIGKPILQTKMLVLDAGMRPVPPGVTGELFIGGAGLARGYLNRPALTAERFIPDPFGAKKGDLLYRTGDLARWRQDGDLECLGRVDHQVKIRGFRVELGEIEAALSRRPEVKEAVVVAREDATGEKALFAYLVPREGIIPAAAEMRRFLLETLPEYMIPARFVALDALPLTPNGKVDRNALPDPEAQAEAVTEYVPPRGPVEEALCGMWAELLGRDRVGVHDNFFELGGHSLFATQLLARIRDMFGVEPSLRDFLENASVAGLSRQIEKEIRAGSGMVAPPIERVDRSQPLPASFAQQRLWFLDQLEPGSPTYNIPTAVRLVGDLDVSALQTALDEVLRRHEVLRTSFASQGGVPYQVIHEPTSVSLPIDDLSDWPESDREPEALRRMAAESRRPFNLATGPMLRSRLIKLSGNEHIVLVAMHHVASDGWSIGVLIREVAALYDSHHRGVASPLAEPGIQYADFAAWQRSWLDGEVLQKQLDYWSDKLAGTPVLEVPTDRPRPAVLTRRGEIRTLRLDKDLLTEIQTLGRRDGATAFMTLLAAYEVLLYRYTGQEDFAVGTPIAGRTHSATEDLIGFFVNTLVLRSNLTGEPSFREVLARVRREALGAYAFQDLPFEKLVGVLHPERDPSRSPLFQVMFVLQNAPLPALVSPDLEMTPLTSDSGTAKFDLTMSVADFGAGPMAYLEYDTDLFEPTTIDRMLVHYKTLLEGIVADPDGPIASLPMLSAEETRRMLGGGGDALSEDELSDLDGLSDEELDAMLSNLSSQDLASDE